ncbi:MAG: hypothetical protein WCQ64_05025 [Acidobacteriota bacterium]
MLRRLVVTSVLFAIGLVLVLSLFERIAHQRIVDSRGENIVGADVYDVVMRRALVPGPDVERIYMGDSVGRQFFPAGQEPNSRLRFLTSNATIGVAGNYYILEDAFRLLPKARDVVLVARPELLKVDLDPPFTSDYFSGFFHTPAQIAEVWRVKHDPQLTVSQIGRFLLPSTLMINSAWRQQPRGFHAVVPGFERRSRAGTYEVEVSTTAAYFLEKMRALAASRGGTFRLIPVPMPDDQIWTDPRGVFTDKFTYVERRAFGDAVHVSLLENGVHWCVGATIAKGFAERHGLMADLPSSEPVLNNICEDPAHPFRIIGG